MERKGAANINIFEETDAWELAQAVNSQNTGKIKKIAKQNPELLNIQDPEYEITLLVWAVGMEKFNSVKALLENGADPDIISGHNGGTALYLAASGVSWRDRQVHKGTKYIKILLEYGADPNIVCVGSERITTIGGKYADVGVSPLMNSITYGDFEKTKALVEAGADINHKTENGGTAAIDALLLHGMIDVIESAHYLIVEKKAIVSEPYYNLIGFLSDDEPNIECYPVDLLRDWMYDLDSEEHKLKMEIVEEFARQGVDYWATEIPKYTLETIKERYPDTWEEYIKRY